MVVTLDLIRAEGVRTTYPQAALEGCDSALVLFAAAWYGKQDAIWVADAGLTATCVDLDHDRLWEMSEAYPEDWRFVNGDVFAFAATTRETWDVVSIDCPSNLFERCAGSVKRWCQLANRVVILGCGIDTQVKPPEGWKLTDLLYRSSFQGGVYWAVLERE